MSAFMAGVMIGAFILGKLADRWPNIVIILSIKIMHLYSLLTYLLTTTIILVFSSTFQLLHVPRIRSVTNSPVVFINRSIIPCVKLPN